MERRGIGNFAKLSIWLLLGITTDEAGACTVAEEGGMLCRPDAAGHAIMCPDDGGEVEPGEEPEADTASESGDDAASDSDTDAMLRAAECEEHAARARLAQLFRAQMLVTNVRQGTKHMMTWQVQQRVDTDRLLEATGAQSLPEWLRRIRKSTGETVHAAAMQVLRALGHKHDHVRSAYVRRVAQQRGRPVLPYSRAYASKVAALADGGDVEGGEVQDLFVECDTICYLCRCGDRAI